DPFLGDHAGGEPVPETQEVRHDGMKLHATMRLAAVQVQGDGKNGELGGHQHIQKNREPAGIRQAVRGKIEQGIEHHGSRRKGNGPTQARAMESRAETPSSPQACLNNVMAATMISTAFTSM